jgi:molecular chaperone DnaK
MDLLIGIDLGTTNSVVATIEGGVAVVLNNRAGYKLTPSVVALAPTGRRLVGQIARRQAITNPTGTIYAAKRLIGRRFSSPEVAKAAERLTYQLVAGEHDDVRVVLGDKTLSLPEVSAVILGELKRDAEAHFGQPVTKAVITVPAHFNDSQRQATKDAGQIAGLEVLRIINEPTSAALAYGASKTLEGKLLVFDLGGGTFDVSVLEVSAGVYQVVATGGDTYLGGEDFDQRIVEWLVFGFAKEHGVDLRKDKMALQRLRDAAEKAKCELSEAKEAQINLPFIHSGGKGSSALHLMRTLTREQLEELTADLVERTQRICEATLADAKLTPQRVTEVLLVGGQTRMPKVQETVRNYFGREPSRGVHPEEVVALGAALQGRALTVETSKMLLLDVTPRSLGIAIAGGYSAILIHKNTTVPTSATHGFTTVRDFQTSVRIMVLQGESERAEENELLGEFLLSGLRKALRGEVSVDVTFFISADGIVSVSARDRELGIEQSIQVTARSGLTAEELRQIIEEQRDFLLEEKQSTEVTERAARLATALQELEALMPSVREFIAKRDFGGDALSKAERTVERARGAIQGTDLSALIASEEAVERTLTLFRGVMQRLGGAQGT